LFLLVASCGGAAISRSTSSEPPASSRPVDEASQEPEPSGPPQDVDCGDFSTCAIAPDGIARCWGRDKNGELGDGTTPNNGARLKRGVIAGLGKVKKIALASEFGCAILDDKKVKCWGTGRIANDGNTFTNAKPTSVNNVEDVDELVASGAIACARSPTKITCWGAAEKAIGTPPPVSKDFKQITAGFTHACALDAKGSVTCWGPSPGDWSTTFAKPAITGARQVVTGDRHACVITKDKLVQCWGMNDAGQLGMKSDTEPHKKPVNVANVANVVKLTAGEASTCAVLADSSVRCWGSNGEGELGLGSRTPDERPAKVAALQNIEDICLASAHGCALTKQNKLLCWGANAFGQLGDGTKERRSTPTAVSW